MQLCFDMDAALFCCCFFVLCATITFGSSFKNEWSVEIIGGLDVANKIAEDHGFTCLGQIGNLQNFYRFVHESHGNIQLSAVQEKQLEAKLTSHKETGNIQRQTKRRRVMKKLFTVPLDPKWTNQWSLLNNGQTNGPKGLDLNVEGAWLQNITGKGILVGVVDNGVEWNHVDLKDNYNADASFNFVDNTHDPSPNSSEKGAGHGTSCAGEIGMVQNGHCGVGVAHESNIAGLRIDLSMGLIFDSQEADAVGHMHDDIMIYSNSWGPPDTGYTFDSPGPLLTATLEIGAEKGRDGKGSIYVWASGNGGKRSDKCCADGYVNSIYTIAIGSADQSGLQASYDEECTAKMAVTYNYNNDESVNNADNSDNNKIDQITTIDLGNQCINTFIGTSASAPLVSGAIALVLQRNPNLTWRDVQYIIVYTSDPTKLMESGWMINGAGLNVSSAFGFGAIDAEAMVTRAKHWINVPEQLHAKFNASMNGTAKDGSDYSYRFEITSDNASAISYLEHVILTVNMVMKEQGGSVGGILNNNTECIVPQAFLSEVDSDDFNPCDYAYQWSNRGDLRILLTSPLGTQSLLLPNRLCDICQNGLENWSFMSVQFWGENPIGVWEVLVTFASTTNEMQIIGDQSFEMYGTRDVPKSVQQIPDNCDPACVRGCAAIGQQYCDSCKNYRNPETLDCLDTCNMTIYNGYCLDYDPTSPTGRQLSKLAIILISTIGGCVVLVIFILIIFLISFRSIKVKMNRRGYSEVDSKNRVQL